MKLLTWLRGEDRETRQDGLTDTLIDLAVARASGQTPAAPTATGALEAAAAMIARCFAAADVDARPVYAGALTPAVPSLIGRALVRKGEAVFAVDVMDGALVLTPATDWDIAGGYDPQTWTYRLNLAGPSRQTTRPRVPAASVVHCRYQVDPEAPWRGIGPIESAALAGKLSAETVAMLADEASGPRGNLLPVPKDGQDPTVDKLKADIRKLRGKTALVESQVSGWGSDTGRVSRDWEPRRLGAQPPDSLISLVDKASAEVYAACGIPPGLFSVQSDGTAQRESYRRLLHSTVVPMARIVQTELTAKLEVDVSLSFDALFAADLSGRARAFQSLVLAGMDPAKAANLAGLMEAE